MISNFHNIYNVVKFSNITYETIYNFHKICNVIKFSNIGCSLSNT